MKKGASETILSYSSHSYTNGDAVLNKKKNGFVFFFLYKKRKKNMNLKDALQNTRGANLLYIYIYIYIYQSVYTGNSAKNRTKNKYMKTNFHSSYKN